ncbi:hypothetical protein QFZ49_005900 [Streptomyces turgidiscabies]|uniref:Uncharacterized protein n=1 Tax=Streptomyces turgidiscabies TaxID=85558 RepID=A0ABU0RVU1_9ACTN|nr:hypothetical protein [Streptomyces turgidiscabies]
MTPGQRFGRLSRCCWTGGDGSGSARLVIAPPFSASAREAAVGCRHRMRSRHIKGDIILVEGVPESYDATATAKAMRETPPTD